MCHKLKCSSEVVTDTLDKTVEVFWGIEKIWIEENQSVYKHFEKEIFLTKMTPDTNQTSGYRISWYYSW